MILLASKNAGMAESFIHDLQHEGFEVELLQDYQQVIPQLYSTKTYQMVILHWEEEQSKVTELFQNIKKNPQLRHVPLICMIKKNQVVEQLIAFESGADEFIYVPYTTLELQLKMRSMQRLLDVQKKLKEKDNQLRALKQVQQILVTLSHYINNSLTPLYTLVQMINEQNPEDARRLKEYVQRTVEFINKVLRTLNNLVQSGEMKVVKEGVYNDLMLDIENELKELQKANK